ncbi:HD-GYP domain-containing protein [Anaeromicropila populeti]|uniref:HDIG domain-containing protein n=1 Tax=Anaeromicropila populeti TaxID=37658 RepID=A0A1I6I5N5_9FIRM|nr:HD-GYP domain-containing protein [Anaeromicropila populeti]SFR62013.1 HDIG domain-containing protein [Anaeromicropila populeti]
MKTKRILTTQARPGMIVAEDVYTFNNQLIIAKNTTLTNRAITRLNFYSITDFRILLDELEPIKMDQNVSFSEEIKRTPEFKKFDVKLAESVDMLKHMLNDFINEGTMNFDFNLLLENTKELLAESRNGIHIFHMLQCMRDYDDLTFVHSVNVALISNVIGKWMNISNNDLDILTLSGLLHDIGKLLVPQDILTKPSTLSEEEYTIIKTHSMKGYELIKDQNCDMRVKLSVLMHHERCDGSGYPSHLPSSKIIEFAKIIAIADTYDAMTSARVYRAPMCPFEVINIFESEGLQKYDPQILITFLQGTAETYIHSNVVLSDGQEGVIVLINKNNLSRPIIKVKEEFIDLSKRHDLYITSMV